MSVHDGHRERLRQRFRDEGIGSFADHNVLELLLTYAIPRRDVNEEAHRLVARFGSLSGVFDAPIEELERTEGLGPYAALLVKLVPQICRRYMIDRASEGTGINTSEDAGNFLLPRFMTETNEVVYVLCLDAKGKVTGCQRLSEGSVNTAEISVRRIVEAALVYGSNSVVIAHNHLSGIALPSDEDLRTTLKVKAALDAVGITLRDHIIISDGDFVSLKESGLFG